MTLSEKIQLPLFPLSIFLLPGERAQLHVFEPRYRQLIADIKETGSPFGIPYASGRLSFGLGARCRLVHVISDYPSGESDILVECEGLFRVEEFQSMKEDKLYPFGTVSLLRGESQEMCSAETKEQYALLLKELEGTSLHFHGVSTDHVLTMYASLNPSHDEKHRFVQLGSAADRERILLQTISLMRSLVGQEKLTEKGFYLS